MSEESYLVSARFEAVGDYDKQMREHIRLTQQFNNAVNSNGSKYEAYQNKIAKSAERAQKMHAAQLAQQQQAIGQYVEGVASRMGSMLDGLVDSAARVGTALAMGAAVGGAALVKKGLEVNATYEDTKMSIAAINSANTGHSFWDSMRAAEPLMEKMRKDAAALPGTSMDLAQIYRTMSAPAFRAGKGSDQIEALSAQLMAAGKAAHLDTDTIARESAMLITGRAGAHNRLGNELFGLSGDKAKEWNHAEGGDLERFNKLTTMVGAYKGAIDGYQQSWSGLSSTLVENAEKFLRLSTGPLFERIKDYVGQANSWFDGHQAKVEQWASTIGKSLVTGLERAVSLAERLASAVERSGVSGHDVATGAEKAVKAYALYKGVRTLQSFMPSASTAMAMGRGLGAVGAAEGTAVTGGAMAEGLAGIVPLLANPIGAAIAGSLVALGVGAAAGAKVLADPNATGHAEALKSSADALSHWDLALDHLKHAFEVFEPAINAVTDSIGVGFLQGVDALAQELEMLTGAVATAASFLRHPTQYLGDAPTLNPDGPIDYDRDVSINIPKLMTAWAEPEKVKPQIVNHNTTQNINRVEITIAGAGDPSRIAKLARQDLLGLARNAGYSRTSQVPYYSGPK